MLLGQAVLRLAVSLGLLQQAPQLMCALARQPCLEQHLSHAVAARPRPARQPARQIVLVFTAQSLYPLLVRMSSAQSQLLPEFMAVLQAKGCRQC